MTRLVGHFIDGQMLAGTGELLSIENPASGTACAKMPIATTDDITQAIVSANTAFSAWSQTSPIKRAQVLYQFRELLHTHSDELCARVTQEHGKTLADAKGSVARGIECLEHCLSLPMQLSGTYSANVARDIHTYTLRQPLGVCVGITPFNFPVMVPLWLALPAIMCGNTCILKPSEQDPGPVLMLAELLHQAGLPKGVLNILQGDKQTVEQLITHEAVQAVSAVASTSAAKHIYALSTQNGKRAQTFGGAKNHAVIMPDADIGEVATALCSAAFGSAGERCMAISVAVCVTDGVADNLIEIIEPKINALTMGNGQSDVDMGPLISAQHKARVADLIAQGEQAGASLLIDGRVHDCFKQAGHFIGPSLFDKVKSHMSIYTEEIFGPVLIIMRVQDIGEAIALVNQNPYGNGTAIFTQNGGVARDYTMQVNVGMCGVNVPIPVPIAYHPFGGWKASNFGDVNLHGNQAIQFFTRLKTVTERWEHAAHSHSLAMPSHI